MYTSMIAIVKASPPFPISFTCMAVQPNLRDIDFQNSLSDGDRCDDHTVIMVYRPSDLKLIITATRMYSITLATACESQLQ